MTPGDAEVLRLAVGELQERLRRLPTAGLRGTELFVLATVAALGAEAFPTAIADRLGMRRSNASAVVADLRRRGLVRPEDEAGAAEGTDGRRRPVVLTEAGRSALREQERERDDWLVVRGTEQLTADESALLRDAAPLLLRLARG